jgi:membrane-associated phospholipid phosphatase
MTKLLLIFCLLDALSALAMRATGLSPSFPLGFLLLLLLVALPFGYGMLCLLRGMERCGVARVRSLPVFGGLLAVAILWLYQLDNRVFGAWCMAFNIFVAWHLWRTRSGQQLRTLLQAVVLIVIGYCTVWNCNYLMLKWTLPRLHDPWLQTVDLRCYGWVTGKAIDYQNLFPLLNNAFAVRFLESAYLLVFAEIAVLLFLLSDDPPQLGRFLTTLFLCYAVGFLVFAVFPVVGPAYYYPESFHTDWQHTLTYRVRQCMFREYQAVRLSSALSGSAHFVALPSLHVAVAALMQIFLCRHRLFFWTFLPINILTCVSSVLLGYHYLLDLPTGLLLAVAVFVGQQKVLSRA